MKKNKENKVTKTVAVSAASIGLVCALFVGVNSLVFAAEKNKTESIIPVTTAASTKDQSSTASEEYSSPSLSVYELDCNPDVKRKDSAMTPEKAAQIGAEHLWEIFGENIDGKIVEMFYEESSFTNRTYWTGYVSNTKSDMEKAEHEFTFVVDAVSGEKKSAQTPEQRSFAKEEAREKAKHSDDAEKCIEISMKYDKKRAEHAKKLYQAAPEEYTKIAEEAAQKHFKNSKVTDSVYLKDRNGIVFTVKDDTGHEIEVAIHAETKQVEFVDDRMDEVDPAFVPDPNSVG